MSDIKPNFAPLALDILRDRYLWRDAEGNITETPEQLLRRVANHVASAEENEADRKKYAEAFYEIMAKLDFLPNSPTLMNAGRPAPHGQLAACFVIGLEDSMADICGALRQQMLIHKSGGGTGFNFSKLRPKGAVVNSTNGKASGPVSFMRLFDLSTEIVQQGGCFTADTLIATAEGAVKISELKEGTLVYSYHPERGFILTPCTAPWLTKRDTEIWELETDKGLKIRATPDHPFMYRCGSAGRRKAYGKLRDLLPGTPLMPLSTCVKKGYRYITLHDGKDTRKPLHRWLMEQAGRGGEVIHHINGNPLDNRLSNLTNEFDNSGHTTHHNSKRIAEGTHIFQHLTPEQHKKAGEGCSKWYASLSEEEKQALRDKNSEALKVENARRMAEGLHNFIGERHPSKDPEIRAKQRKGRLAQILWYLQTLGHRPTADNIEQLEKEAGFSNPQRYKLSSYIKAFGSFENALAYADARNCKVKSVTPLKERADVWNVEIPETHNYVVCNEDCTAGVVVSNTRRGANMAILNADHPDIEEFISCKDEEGKITNFNLSVGITDAFMDYAVNLPDSSEAILLRKIARHAWKSGDPGVVFLDTMNYDNPCPQLGRIEGTNPCLAGATRILTDEGYRRIDECVGEKVNVWNGKEWSSVIPRITGHNQPMRMLYFEEDAYPGDAYFPIRIECTKYHKFKRADGVMVTAADLKPGDKLFPYDLPCVPSETGDGEDARTGWGVTVLRNEPCMKNADTVYCLTEPKEHMFIAEGILVGNCGESPLLPSESCNLGSINLAHMVTPHSTFDWGRLRDTVILATRFLDNVIDVNQYPLPEIEQAVKRTRKIGLGVMGWADLLYQLRIPYDSKEAVELAEEIMEHIRALGHIQSGELGIKKGIPADCQHLYRRNATVTCVAPTGTLALLADCSSGIEPVFSLSHTRRITLGDGTIKEVEVVNPHYAELCADVSLSDEDVASIAKTAYQIPWHWHVAHQAVFQRYTDLAVSKTVNLPADATVEDVLAVYVEAWRQNCKGVTVYRNGSRSSQVLTDNGMPEVKCTTC